MKPEVSNELGGKFMMGEGFYDSIKKSLIASSEIAGDEKELKKKIRRRYMFPKDITKIFNLSSRQLNDWEKRGVRLGKRKSTHSGSWRMYSVEDSIGFAILLALRDTGMPIKQSQKVLRSLQNSNLIEKALNTLGHAILPAAILTHWPKESASVTLAVLVQRALNFGERAHTNTISWPQICAGLGGHLGSDLFRIRSVSGNGNPSLQHRL